MDLQLSVFLLFVLFTGGRSLSCYECTSLTGSCAEQRVTTCPELSTTCISSTAVALIEGNPFKAKFKGCVPSNACPYTSISSANVSLFCCNKDLCNAKDADVLFCTELSGDSSPNIFTVPSIPIPNPPIPNGKRCYYCIGQSCLNIMDCSGGQDRCIKGTGENLETNFNGQSFPINGCANKAVCESVASFSCCKGNPV
ncbi:hypothetical protein PO909_007705 [Leuciscus waleckii]